MRALVLGSGGQLGSELMKLLPPGTVGLTHANLSVAAERSVHAAVRDRDTVFNCAAYNAVDAAQSEPEIAYSVNSRGAGIVASACAEQGARLVHFSTNFVFDGSKDDPYVESDDADHPLSVYGMSKRAGETLVLDRLQHALVIRSAAIFGDRGSVIKGGSFPERILKAAKSGQRLRVVSDQRVNPTYARDLAQAAIELATGRLDGIVHVVAAGCCAWDEFAREVLAACGVEAQVESVLSSAVSAPARRPLNGCMASEKVALLRAWREGVREWAAKQAEKA